MTEDKAKRVEKTFRDIEYDKKVIKKINEFNKNGKLDFEIDIKPKAKQYSCLTIYDFELDHMRLARRLCSFLKREFYRDLRKKEKELAKL